jgi:hypothetical protein
LEIWKKKVNRKVKRYGKYRKLRKDTKNMDEKREKI